MQHVRVYVSTKNRTFSSALPMPLNVPRASARNQLPSARNQLPSVSVSLSKHEIKYTFGAICSPNAVTAFNAHAAEAAHSLVTNGTEMCRFPTLQFFSHMYIASSWSHASFGEPFAGPPMHAVQYAANPPMTLMRPTSRASAAEERA